MRDETGRIPLTTMTTSQDPVTEEQPGPQHPVAVVKLSSMQGFHDAVERYLDENKPDNLCRQQMEAWNFEWIPYYQGDSTNGNTVLHPSMNLLDDSQAKTLVTQSASTNPSATAPTPLCTLAGTLRWSGPYLTVTLQTWAVWTGEAQGALLLTCTAHAEFVDVTDKDPKTRQIFKRMKSRLEKDSYIQKLLVRPRPISKNSSYTDLTPLVEACDASILLNDIQLEERVHWTNNTLEAIRRAVFSQAESTMDVLELILNFPWLPTSIQQSYYNEIHPQSFPSSLSSNSTTVPTTTKLADRAKLRLLEDALLQACEQVEEDELVEDLHISKKSKHVEDD